jgi:hypothetical protein
MEKMMLKDLAAIQQQQQQLAAADENMSNLTSASGDQASVSSHPLPPHAKKKRSLPGNPGIVDALKSQSLRWPDQSVRFLFVINHHLNWIELAVVC